MTLEIDFEKAMNQAKELEELASRITGEYSCQLEEASGLLASGWSGSAADAYLKKLQRTGSCLHRSGTQLQRTANTVYLITKAIYEAEQAAASIAHTHSC